MTGGQLEVIRGRQGRIGLRGMSLSTFLDLCWAEIWDDAPPMGDRSTYREIVTALYVDGKDPSTITYADSKGKRRRLTEGSATVGGAVPTMALDEARRMMEAAKAAAQAKIPETE